MMIGKKLKKLRLNFNLTKREVAGVLGIHETTYGKYELGHREPDFESIKRLATYFNVSLDYLFGTTDDPAPPRKQEANILLSKAPPLFSPVMPALSDDGRKKVESYAQYVAEQERKEAEKDKKD
jgi:transcriptional regulator with XRE-family HTH domain